MMLKKLAYYTLALAAVPLALGLSTPKASAAVEIGAPAPQFKAVDIHGEDFDLAAMKGKTVVLEWTNHECPFVVKHYSTNNMQSAQKTATDNGVVWVSIVSSAEGNQGHITPEQAKTIHAEKGIHATTKILDASGEIGQQYAAKTTPHMFVINAEGNIAYAGAIDDNPSPSEKTVEGAKNYVLAALDDLASGRPVETPKTSPYGCSVKY